MSPAPSRRKATVSTGMTAGDFARIALSLDGAEQGSHMGATDFRVGGRIFATLAYVDRGYGNLMLTPDDQAMFVEELPDVFIAPDDGWGRMGVTLLVLAKANEDVLRGALHAAWRRRVEMNARTRRRTPGATKTDATPGARTPPARRSSTRRR